MYLMKFIIDKTNPTMRRALADKQKLHSMIQSMFNTDRKSSNVLYRINGDSLYLTSNKIPQKSDYLKMVSLREMCSINGIHNFSLITIPRKGVGKKKYMLRTYQERIEWLQKQGFQNGFEILNAREMGKEFITSGSKNFNTNAFRYDGILRITDSEKFQAAQLKGIGPMKAYGCGMLLVV